MKNHFFSRVAGTLALGLLSSSCLAQTSPAAGTFAIKPDDRIVFYGDSITDSRQYTNMVETYILTRFPNHKVHFVHSGWGGDRVGGGGGGNIATRLKRDVLEHKPTVVTVMLGMNDGSYRAFDENIFNTYAKGYKNLVSTVKEGAPGVRITAIVPSPYDDITRDPTFEGGYNKVLLKFGDYVRQLAAEEKLTVADLNTPVVNMLVKAKAKDPALAPNIIRDRVHPGPAGHLIMAQGLLEAWGAPTLVTAVEVDAAGKKVTRQENTTVTNFQAGDTLTWTQLDKSLPFFVDTTNPEMALAVSSSDFIEKLNQQPLKVTGLTAARYQLKIDDSVVGTFTKEELAGGINLATQNTPMVAQARKVTGLTNVRSNQFNNRWRNVQVPLQAITSPKAKAAVDAALPTILAALDEEVAESAAAQRAGAQPVEHTFQLSPAA